jgi:hypothetical protein
MLINPQCDEARKDFEHPSSAVAGNAAANWEKLLDESHACHRSAAEPGSNQAETGVDLPRDRDHTIAPETLEFPSAAWTSAIFSSPNGSFDSWAMMRFILSLNL